MLETVSAANTAATMAAKSTKRRFIDHSPGNAARVRRANVESNKQFDRKNAQTSRKFRVFQRLAGALNLAFQQ
jgi:hypothetical protein